MTGSSPASRAGAPRLCVALVCAALLLLVLVAALGDSAAVPGLGPATWHPPWDLAVHPPSWLVSVLQAGGWLTGAAGVWSGLTAVRDGWRPRPGRVVLAGVAAALLLTLVPPSGSADHLSYVAYGRIAAAGDDPYVVPPISWRDGHDPVASAVQPPWQTTPSIYGPVADAVFAAVAWAGGGSLRLTVWWWQLLCAAAFVAVGLLLDRSTRGDPALRARAAVLWTLNPLLLGQLVLGAHVDVVAAACAVAALVCAARRPFLAGALVGAAVGTKATYGLAAVAILWGLRRLPRNGFGPGTLWRALASAAIGGLVVLVPAHLLAGPHVFDQLRRASGFTSIASPWRAVVNLVELATGAGSLRGVVVPLSLLVAAALTVPLGRRIASATTVAPGAADVTAHVITDSTAHVTADITGGIARAALVLTAAWALTAPYALPWYDAMVWAPLALVGTAANPGALSLLDRALLVRLAALAVAYVPGRVVGLSPTVETLTLGLRRYVAPAVVLAVLVVVVRWSLRPGRRLQSTGAGSPKVMESGP